MKKSLILVSCFVVTLILSPVSFAQEEAAAPFAPTLPYTYMAPAPKLFGGKFAALAGKRLRAPLVLPVAAADPACAADASVAPVALPYPYGISDVKRSAVRRVARLTQPKYVPYPVPVPYAVTPPVAGEPVEGVAAGAGPGSSSIFAPGPIAQTGRVNYSSQRSGGPVINLMSIVRQPRTPFDPPYGYPLPLPAQP